MNSFFLKAVLLSLAALAAFAAEIYKYSYDEMGRLTKAESSGGLVLLYKYDASGNLLRREIAAPAKPAVEAAKSTTASGGKKSSKSKAAPAGGGR